MGVQIRLNRIMLPGFFFFFISASKYDLESKITRFLDVIEFICALYSLQVLFVIANLKEIGTIYTA